MLIICSILLLVNVCLDTILTIGRNRSVDKSANEVTLVPHQMKRNKMLTLSAGPLEMSFDPETGWIRRIRFGRREVVRALFGAVRDQNWNTIVPSISLLDKKIASDHFQITFKAICQSHAIHFEWIGILTGEKDGSVRYDFEGIAQSHFSKNRIGLCLLHPIEECAGKPCRVKHTDGSETQSSFPSQISPHQAFKDIGKISHEIAPGIEAEVIFEGDVFEMEDQRNWTDASFKTYSTPLDRPFPADMRRGEKVKQSVQIKIHGDTSAFSTESSDPYKIELDCSMASKPTGIRVGLGLATPIFLHDEIAVERLKALAMNHLRMEVYPSRPDWKDQVLMASQLSGQFGVKLHLAVYLGNQANEELIALVEHLKANDVPVELIQLFKEGLASTDPSLIGQAISRIQELELSTQVAAGTNACFAELNRNPESAGETALPCYSINPQVHAFDDMSLMETLEVQASTVENAWKLFERPVVVSPITLKPRFHPNATGRENKPAADELPSQVDLRQSTLFAAAWTLGSLANLLSSPHLHSLTYFETIGSLGIMEHRTGSQYPSVFKTTPGCVFPVYHVFRDLAGYSEMSMVDVDEAGEIACIQLIQGEQHRVMIANLTPETKEVEIQLESLCVSFRMLESENVEAAMDDPDAYQSSSEEYVVPNGVFNTFLPPYAIATLDLLAAE